MYTTIYIAHEKLGIHFIVICIASNFRIDIIFNKMNNLIAKNNKGMSR